MRKKIILSVSFLLLILLALGLSFAWRACPIITGYGVKTLASAFYLQHRPSADIIKEDLGDFPFTLASFTVSPEDSSVYGSILGFARQKAIYREGIGCTLINDFSESEVRKQRFDLPIHAVSNMDSIPWPNGEKISDSLPPNINKGLLNKALDNALNAESQGKSAYTRAVIVVYDGKIAGERYAQGFDKNTVMLGWSISKSFTAALIGVLVNDGKLIPDNPAPVQEWAKTPKERITVRHLLQHTTGLDFEENHTKPCELTTMLFKSGDMAGFVSKLTLKHEPGKVFNYSSGNTNVLSRIIRNIVGEDEYAAFPYHELFHKINMYTVLLEPDASGTFIGSSYSYATARDFARFGLLYLNDGQWNGQQILPPGWVKETVKPCTADSRKHYGLHFWLNGYSESDSTRLWYPDVPADMFFADGYGGQDIYIIPSKKLVIVRLGLHIIDENEFIREVLQSIN